MDENGFPSTFHQASDRPNDPPPLTTLTLSSGDRVVLVSALSEQASAFLKLAELNDEFSDYWLWRRSENIRMMLRMRW